MSQTSHQVRVFTIMIEDVSSAFRVQRRPLRSSSSATAYGLVAYSRKFTFHRTHHVGCHRDLASYTGWCRRKGQYFGKLLCRSLWEKSSQGRVSNSEWLPKWNCL